MATGAEGAITTQPRSKRKEIETFVRDLDPLQVQGLSYNMPDWVTIHVRLPYMYMYYVRCLIKWMVVGLTFSILHLLPAEWTEQEVVEKYLKPVNMEHLTKPFLENRINGAVLLALEER